METSESETKSTGRQWYNRCLLSLLKALGQAYTNPEKIVCVHLKWQLQTKFHFRPSQYTLLYFIPVLNFFLIRHIFCFRCKESQNRKGSHQDFLYGGGIRGTQGQDPHPPQHSEGSQDQRHLQVTIHLLQQGKESAVCTLGHLQSVLQLTFFTY